MLPDIPNYTLLKKLGAGAFAEVWLAEHRINKRRVAIKILKESIAAGSDAEALFIREGEVLASFNERNIVTIYDNARAGDHAWLIMELLPGGSLLDRMQAQGLEVGEAIGHVVQIAAALDAAHRRGIIHRDLKPANIMLRDETTPVLTDFGASRMLERSTIYGRDGGVVGTPQYMSPEQITGQPLDGRSDLYALGVMFHELLTGRAPYAGASLQEILALHLHAPLPQLPANLAVLQPLLDRLLAKDREQRFATGAAFADALRRTFLDDAALRTLIRFAPASAWSSQLKALGFDLDTAQRTEVRIAQGDYLKAFVATQPIVSATPSVPAPAPAVAPSRLADPRAEPLPAGPAQPLVAAPAAPVALPAPELSANWLLVLRASAWALAVSTLLAWIAGAFDMNWAAEALLAAAFLPLLVHALSSAWIAWRQRRRVLPAALLLLAAATLVALYMGWYWLAPDREAVVEWLPCTLLAGLVLAVWLLATRLGRWQPALWMGGAVAAALGLFLGLVDPLQDVAQWLLLLPILAVTLLWAWLGWRRLGWTKICFVGAVRTPWLIAVTVALLLPGLAALLAQWLDWRRLEQSLSGRWYGVGAAGRVMMDFEPGGGLVQYGNQDGEQRPWVGRWSIAPPDRGRSYLTIDDGQTRNGLSYASVGAAGTETLVLDNFGSLLDQPTPWHLQRSELLQFDPAMAGRWRLRCTDRETLGLWLKPDGTGTVWQPASAPGGQDDSAELRWLTLANAEIAGHYVAVLSNQRRQELPISGRLPVAGAVDGQVPEFRFPGTWKVNCTLEMWR